MDGPYNNYTLKLQKLLKTHFLLYTLIKKIFNSDPDCVYNLEEKAAENPEIVETLVQNSPPKHRYRG